MHDGDTVKLEEVNLKQTLLVGDEFNFLDWPGRAFRRYPKVSSRLRRAGFCVISEPRKECCHCVGVIETLEILSAQIDVKYTCGRLSHLISTNTSISFD